LLLRSGELNANEEEELEKRRKQGITLTKPWASKQTSCEHLIGLVHSY
jgi:hypothetical protein